MRHRRRTPSLLVSAACSAALVLVVSACSSSSSSDSASTSAASVPSDSATVTTATDGTQPGGSIASTSAAAPTTTVDAALTDPVGKYLITSVPKGYRVQDDDLANTGAADLARAAEEDGASDAQSFLEGIGYQHGYRRIWATQDFGRSIYVALDLLSNEAGAKAYCERTAQNMRNKASLVEGFGVEGRANAVGVRVSDESGSASAVFEAKGSWCIEVLSAGTNDIPAASQREQAATLFLAQYDALTA